MTSNDFIDQLERELRAAGQRRARLELARLPRLPAGVGVLVVAAVIAVAVAVPVLATHSGSPAAHAPGGGTSGSGAIVFGCPDAVSGLVPAGTAPALSLGGTVSTGPVAWGFLRKDATHAAVYGRHFVSAPAMVGTGRDVSVTVSIPAAERQRVSLDYGVGSAPRSRLSVSQGVSSVTFVPCRVGGQSQFPGGFIVTRAQCAEIVVRSKGPSLPRHYFIPLGRSCPGSSEPRLRVLNGNGIGRASFGERPKAAIGRLDALLGRAPSRSHADRNTLCGIDRTVYWPGLAVYFQHHRFVGYSYGSSKTLLLATARGLRVGDTVETGRGLYGSAFKVSSAQGGSWLVRTRHGRLDGFLSDVTNPKGHVLTIEAGYVGCPALSP